MSRIFLRSARVATWNLEGWANATDERFQRLQDAIAQLLASHDIIMLQETRSDLDFEDLIKSLHPHHTFYWSHPAQLGDGGGVAIAFDNRWLQQFPSVQPCPFSDARGLTLNLRGPLGALSICVLHVLPSWTSAQQRRCLQACASSLPHFADALSTLGGDFNFIVAAGDAISRA